MSNQRHPATYSEAIGFILSFISKYPDAASRSLGGFMNKSTLDNILKQNGRNDLYGLLAWYCFNEEVTDYPYFFLSFTNKEDFDAGSPPTEVIAETDYYTPSSFHAYTGEISETALLDYIHGTDYSESGNAVSIARSTVAAFNAGYMENFILADDGKDYRGAFCGFFIQEDTGISDLIIDDACIGINYFFGINDEAEPKICIVLFPVDDNGLIANDRLIMEKSYP